MDLLKLLDSVGGTQSLGSLASSLGLDSSKTNELVGDDIGVDDVLDLAKKFF